MQSLTLYLAASKDATKVSYSAIMFEGSHHLKSSLWNISRMGLPLIHLQKNLGSNGVLLYPRLVTIASTALLKLRPDNGKPYRLPSIRRIIPGGALTPWGVAIHNIKSSLPGVTRYAPIRSPPRSVKPYSADSAKNTLIDVAATSPQYISSGL